jgi:hypothetical protein
VVNISSPKIYSASPRRQLDYYHVIVLADDGTQTKVYLPVSALGISDPSRSIVLAKHNASWLRISLVNPAKIHGKHIEVAGTMTTDSGVPYINKVTSVKILDP